MRGLLAGGLALASVQVLVSSQRAYGGVGSVFGSIAGTVDAFLSPNSPGIPDRRHAASMMPATSSGVGPQGLALASSPAAGGMSTAGAIAGVLAAATSVLGAPYAFGGVGPKQFDCSGLVTWAYRAVGIDLAPLTFTQAEQGVGIPVGAQYVRPGDLVFTPGMTPVRSLGHVGIALTSTTWITAPHTGAFVHVSNIPWGDVERVRRII